MAILRDWILAQADEEPVEGVVLGRMGWARGDDPKEDYNAPEDGVYPSTPFNKLLSWEDAQPFILYKFDSGYGAPGCGAVTAWTSSWVIGVSTYDGSTSPFRLPRNPLEHEPEMPGGG